MLAAQAAIEAPLLEVSIDGARGVVFNVTGGNDLSMHEVNEAAEVITAAVSPDANIIFGATIKPDMTDKVEITVIATGFDGSYFAKRGASLSDDSNDDDSDDVSPLEGPVTDVEADEVETINMDEDAAENTSLREEVTPFHKEADTHDPSIWTSDDDEKAAKNDEKQTAESTTDEKEEEHDVPAFLRRFRRKKHNEENEKND